MTIVPIHKKAPEFRSLSIIVPLFNEESLISELTRQLGNSYRELNKSVPTRIVFVNNGSTDSTLQKLLKFMESGIPAEVITLSRNFGYEAAVIAGLDYSSSDLYAVVDGDGEDPIDLLPNFLSRILDGAEIVQGLRMQRQESRLLQMFRRTSYWVLSKISDEPFGVDVGNFSMFTRRVRDGVLIENKHFPFMRATISRIGFRVEKVAHDRNKRIDGKSHYKKVSLLKFALLGFLTSTTWPLRFTFYFGFIVSGLVSFFVLMSFFIGLNELAWKRLLILLISQILVMIGIVGIYVARVYKHSLGRPIYYFDLSESYTNIEA
jgi:glycosyltransferase involved in cell wall biosynthesis